MMEGVAPMYRSNRKTGVLVATVLAALVSSASAHAQSVTNGEFESGPAGWAWKRAVTASGGACDAMVPFTATYSNTPQYRIGSDRAALVTPGTNYGYLCGEIEQTVFVPVGATLKFDLRMGDASTAYSNNYGQFTARAEDTQLGLEYSLLSVTGTNCNANFPDCNPSGVPKSVDISRFWGRSATLKFRGSTSGSGGGVAYPVAPTHVWIDSVRLESPTLSQAKPKAGGYYNPRRSGQGLHISKAPDGQYSLIWYTFLPTGEPVWYMSDIAYHVSGVWQSPLYKFTWDTSSNSRNPGQLVGDVRIESLSSTKFNFMWDFHSDGDIAGFDGGEPMQFLTGNEGYTGMWYEPALSGWGFTVDHEVGDSSSLTVFYYDGPNPVWAYSSIPGDPEDGATATLFRYTSTGLCPQCQFETVSRTPTVVGEMGVRLNANQGWFVGEGSLSDWQRGSANAPAAFLRLTNP